ERSKGGTDARGNQGVIGLQVALNVEGSRELVFPGHAEPVGPRNKVICELVHTVRDFSAAASGQADKAGGEGKTMGQRLDTWQDGSGDRRWLSQLIDAM